MTQPAGDREAWIAAGGSARALDLLQQVGQMAVFVQGASRCIAGIHPDRPSVGAVCDWIGGLDVLAAAEGWLAAQGCEETRGPLWLSPWFGQGANLGPLDTEPLLFEPTEPGGRWLEAGYAPHAHYLSILAGHAPNIAAGMDAAAGLAAQGWSLQPLDLEEDFDESVRLVHEVMHRAHAQTRGFTRVPLDVLAAWYRPMAGMLEEPVLSRVAMTAEGEPVGFILAYPETGADRSWFQILSLAVLPECQHKGVASWMVASVHQVARKAGIDEGVHALVRRRGQEDTTWFRGEVLRRYAVFAKSMR